MKFKVKDKVILIAGKDKGKEGEIVKIFRNENTAIVSGVNLQKQHVKASNNIKGGIIEAPAKINISNLAILDPKTNKPSKIGFEFDKKGKKIRISKKSGTKI